MVLMFLFPWQCQNRCLVSLEFILDWRAVRVFNQSPNSNVVSSVFLQVAAVPPAGAVLPTNTATVSSRRPFTNPRQPVTTAQSYYGVSGDQDTFVKVKSLSPQVCLLTQFCSISFKSKIHCFVKSIVKSVLSNDGSFLCIESSKYVNICKMQTRKLR